MTQTELQLLIPVAIGYALGSVAKLYQSRKEHKELEIELRNRYAPDPYERFQNFAYWHLFDLYNMQFMIGSNTIGSMLKKDCPDNGYVYAFLPQGDFYNSKRELDFVTFEQALEKAYASAKAYLVLSGKSDHVTFGPPPDPEHIMSYNKLKELSDQRAGHPTAPTEPKPE